MPKAIVFARQAHSTNVAVISSADDDRHDVDGLISENPNILLGVYTADCAPILFSEGERFGALHVGWRGLCHGIIEKMMTHFSTPRILLGPLLPVFEIQKDFCYFALRHRFGEEFFSEKEHRLFFHFFDALSSLLPSLEWSGYSTQSPSWASNRRGEKSKNISSIGKSRAWEKTELRPPSNPQEIFFPFSGS